MSGHRKWEELKIEKTNHPETIAYVQGYILACDDFLHDADNRETMYVWQLEAIIEDSRREAIRTLETLTSES